MIQCPVCKTSNEDNYVRCKGCKEETNPRRKSGSARLTITEDNRKKAEVLKKKGNEAFTIRDFSAAVHFYMKALQNNPAHDGAWNNMGLAYRSMNDLKSAVKCFVKAIEINPNNGSALANREACEYEMNRTLLGLGARKDEKPAQAAAPSVTTPATTETKPAKAVSTTPAVSTPAAATPVITTQPVATAAPVRVEPERAVEAPVETRPPQTEKPVESTVSSVEEETIPIHPFQQAQVETESTPKPAPKPGPEPAGKLPLAAPRAPKVESVPPTAPVAGTVRQVRPDESFTPSTSVSTSQAPPEEPEKREEPEEMVPPRQEIPDEQYVVERRMGPLGLRSTMVIKTAAEIEYLKEYQAQRQRRRKSWPPSVHMKSAYYERSGEDVEEEPDEPYMERFRIEARKRKINRESTICDYCRNVIDTENRSIRCMECSDFFCAICERDFRGERNEGDTPLCARCYLKHVKAKEQLRQSDEKARRGRERKKTAKRKRERKADREIGERAEAEIGKRRGVSGVRRRRKQAKSEGVEELAEDAKVTETDGKGPVEGPMEVPAEAGGTGERKRQWLKRATESPEIPTVEVEVLDEDVEDMEDLEEVTAIVLLADDEDIPEAIVEAGDEDGTEETKDKKMEVGSLAEVDEVNEVDEGDEVNEVNEADKADEADGIIEDVDGGLDTESDDVFDVLAKKFEDGEIDEEEYERLIERALAGDTDIF